MKDQGQRSERLIWTRKDWILMVKSLLKISCQIAGFLLQHKDLDLQGIILGFSGEERTGKDQRNQGPIRVRTRIWFGGKTRKNTQVFGLLFWDVNSNPKQYLGFLEVFGSYLMNGWFRIFILGILRVLKVSNQDLIARFKRAFLHQDCITQSSRSILAGKFS